MNASARDVNDCESVAGQIIYEYTVHTASGDAIIRERGRGNNHHSRKRRESGRGRIHCASPFVGEMVSPRGAASQLNGRAIADTAVERGDS